MAKHIPALALVSLIIASAFCSASAGAQAQLQLAPLSARMVERLRVNGLKADDPQLRAHLEELANSRRRTAAITPLQMTERARAFVARRPASSDRTQSGITASPPGAQLPPPILVPGGHIGLTWAQIFGNYLLDGKALADTSIRIESQACGVSTTTPGKGSSVTNLHFVPPPFVHTMMMDIVVSVNGVASNRLKKLATNAAIPGVPAYTFTASISEGAPHFAGGVLGIPPGAFSSTAKGDRISTDPSGPAGEGTDTIAYGINVVNGWTATATIANVHSYRDAPHHSGTNDDFRSATISQQPQHGRLETKVHWTYEPGESISYDVIWTFSDGAMFARITDTDTKKTKCTDEM